MRTVRISLKERSYNIVIGNSILNLLGKFITRLDIGTSAYIVSNRKIKNIHAKALTKVFSRAGLEFTYRLIADTEESKSVEVAFRLINELARFDKARRVFIIAFGGGVVGDVAGFLASIYKRGIPYIQVPTTLLAQVDSAIGGKTAVDLIQGKNLVGAFYQPRLVYSDTRLLRTLGIRQLRCGLAEVVKYGIIRDRNLFNYLEKNYPRILALKEEALEFIVARASYIKAKVVEKDERETKGIRVILNFGHTIGHAIEAASGYKGYHHGEAIALGMLVAVRISSKLNFLNRGVGERIEHLIRVLGLPTKIKKLSLESIIKAHYRDKKFIGPKNRFVLIEGLGRTKIVENIDLAVIKEAIASRIA
jgi:3-dehydroquinate synthase